MIRRARVSMPERIREEKVENRRCEAVSAEPHAAAFLGFAGFFLSVSRRRTRPQRVDQSVRYRRYVLDCLIEGGFIRARRPIRTAQFADELDG
jgi:hypothetical protein